LAEHLPAGLDPHRNQSTREALEDRRG
jgi:hypothetical protein